MAVIDVVFLLVTCHVLVHNLLEKAFSESVPMCNCFHLGSIGKWKLVARSISLKIIPNFPFSDGLYYVYHIKHCCSFTFGYYLWTKLHDN